ncbi:MAG TPA: cbb3-type cytochrome c oxidase subunit I [Myxococcales bacterium]|nr:cbb3-type cytochrome c oxidase subunit I [Myxococcales bacterium]
MIQKDLRAIILIELLLPLLLTLFGVYHGVLQVLYRAGIIQDVSFGGIGYYQGLTAHGVINAIVLTTFFAVAFGHAVISQYLDHGVSKTGAWTGFVLMVGGTLVAAYPIFTGRANVLYTFYAPMKAHPLFYFGVVFLVVGSWVSFWSWIPGYLRWRKSHPGRKTPLAAVGMFSAFIIWQICTLPVAYEVIVQLIPWSLGWTPGVNVVLSRLLFWFFGHPLVYFWLLPAYVMYYTIMPRLAGGKLYSDFYGRFVFMAFIVLSSPLGLHHQFTEPAISSGYKALHASLTFLVAVPSLVTAFTLAASLEYGARQNGGKGLFAWWARLPHFDPQRWLFPYLFMGLVIFVLGGITGIINASYGMASLVHNTAWIPAHFHLTVAGPTFLAILGMSLYLCAGLLGKNVAAPRAAVAVPYLWTLGTFTFSAGLFYGGLRGVPRRTNLGMSFLDSTSDAYRPDWVIGEYAGAVGGCLMGLSVLLFFYVLVRSLLAPASVPAADAFALPDSAAYHDEAAGVVTNFRPWVIAGIVAILISYIPPLVQVLSAGYPLAAG